MKQIIFKSLVVRSLAFIMLIMCTVSVSAQYYMNVYKNNGQKYQFLVSSIDSVRISNEFDSNPIGPTSVVISFVANGGVGEMSQIISSAENLTLPANTFTYDGYEFTGWNTKADGSGTSYSNEQSITVAENIVLYAQWKEILIEAEDQVFIGVVAFNKMVNQLPITSNLEKVKSFISTQKNDYDFTAFAYSVSKGNLMFDAEGLPEFDNIFMLNFSDGTDNYSNMLWGNENRMIPLANVYDTVQYDLTGRPGLNSYALGFGDDVGFSGKMHKVVTGKGGYYNAKSSADLQPTFNDIAESIIASSKNVVLQTNPGYYSEIMGYKYFRFIFEADGIKDTLDAKMEGMPNTGYTLTVMRSTNNYAHFDEPAIGTIDETTGKVKIPLNNLTFTYEGEELPYEYEILFSSDEDIYYVDVEEASTSEDIAKRIAVVMVLDCSTSMGSAFEPMKDAANDFIDILEGMISEPKTDSLYVSFNANGGEGEMANIEFVKGETVTVSINTFTRVGYKFIGWNTKADGTGLSYTENEPVKYLRRNLKLYAQWEYDPYNGHEYVDLGLPSGLKWATCNVGAYSPETYSSYFAWGETEPKYGYSWLNYKHCNNGSSSKLTKYNVGSSWGTVDNITTLELEDDAAHVNWGGAWRMPTYNDWNELKNNCAWTWTTLNGVKGYKVVSKSNGNSIFLPAAGYCEGTDVYDAGSDGGYWSSSLYSDGTSCAYYLFFNSGTVSWSYDVRYYGQAVRAVCLDTENIPTSYTISFNANGGEGEMSLFEIWSDETPTLPICTFTRDGYEFIGWNTKADGTGSSYRDAQEISVKENITLYAQWRNLYELSGTHNGYEYVDLGLPSGLKWATCNVGASSPEGYGSYFAWGETSPKSNYVWDTYKYSRGSWYELTKYCGESYYGYNDYTDNKTTLDMSDDAARVNWGGAWRMPTQGEQYELIEKCTWTWTTLNGINGYKVTSKSNGNSIFLPAAGARGGTSFNDVGSYGFYWSSSLFSSNPSSAYGLNFDSGNVSWYFNSRCFSYAVRAVCLDTENIPTSYTISFNANGGEGEMSLFEIWSDETPTLPICTFTRDGYEFIGWNTKADGTGSSYSDAQEISVKENITLYAQWEYDPYNGYEYVDLGLPSGLKWATCNVGAESPEDYGDYFAWGETSPKSDYEWETYKFRTSGDSDDNVKFSKYNTDSDYGPIDTKTTLDLIDDAAHVNWGGSWRMPTRAEQDELRKECTWTWTTLNGIKGYKVTSKSNGNSIFLPAAGCYRSGTNVGSAGYYGHYWSSSLYSLHPYLACYLTFDSGRVGWTTYDRSYGLTVRAVCP